MKEALFGKEGFTPYTGDHQSQTCFAPLGEPPDDVSSRLAFRMTPTMLTLHKINLMRNASRSLM